VHEGEPRARPRLACPSAQGLALLHAVRAEAEVPEDLRQRAAEANGRWPAPTAASRW
jgi:hypothetical protein